MANWVFSFHFPSKYHDKRRMRAMLDRLVLAPDLYKVEYV